MRACVCVRACAYVRKCVCVRVSQGVLVNLRFVCEEARMMGIDGHVCELQLVLQDFPFESVSGVSWRWACKDWEGREGKPIEGSEDGGEEWEEVKETTGRWGELKMTAIVVGRDRKREVNRKTDGLTIRQRMWAQT